MSNKGLEETIQFLEATAGLLVNTEGEITRRVVDHLKELQRARKECDKPIMLKCECGDSYKQGEQDTMGRLEPFSQADVNIRWTCEGCGHEVSSGPFWGK